MSREVSIRELRNRTKQVIERIESGEAVYLTKNGRRIAEIHPVGERSWGQQTIAYLDGLPHMSTGLAELFRDDDDATIEAERRERALSG